MTWRDNLRSASFRGVSFKVEDASLTGGRRTVTHEYPLRDTPYVEDMGLKARTFTIEGFVIGDDYMSARDALQAALEAGGAGQLIHPYLGTKQVICSSYTLRESKSDGRMATFSMTLEEANEQPTFPSAGLDYTSLVGSAADSSLISIATSFIDIFNTGLQPQFAIDSLEGIIRDLSTTFTRIFNGKSSDAQSRAFVNSRLAEIYTDAPTIVRSPDTAVSAVNDIVTLVASYLPGDRETLDAMVEGYRFTSGEDPPVLTATRILETNNRNALFALARQTIAVEAARAAIEVDYVSYDEAITARDSVTDMIDEQADIASDDVYVKLSSLRKEVVRAIPGDERDLPRLLNYRPVATLPALVISHKLYGNIDEEADIVARNRIRHPGFVIGGRDLEVLSNA